MTTVAAHNNDDGSPQGQYGPWTALQSQAFLGSAQIEGRRRALQEHEIRRVGENRQRKVTARGIAATNRDLAQDVKERRFRPDLFYRSTWCNSRYRRCENAPASQLVLAIGAQGKRRPPRGRGQRTTWRQTVVDAPQTPWCASPERLFRRLPELAHSQAANDSERPYKDRCDETYSPA